MFLAESYCAFFFLWIILSQTVTDNTSKYFILLKVLSNVGKPHTDETASSLCFKNIACELIDDLLV